MGDYKVVYRTKEVDVDSDRPRRRVPGALDPYDYPEDREELKRGVAEAKARVARKYRVDSHRDFEDSPSRVERDDYSSVSVRERERERGGSVRKTYSVHDDRVERESEVRSSPARSSASTQPGRTSDRRQYSVEVDSAEKASRAGSVRRDDRQYEQVDYEFDRTNRSRHGPYVIETAPGYEVEILRDGHGKRDRKYFAEVRSASSNRRDSPSVREIDTRKTEIVRESRDSPRSSSRLTGSDGPYASGARSRDDIIDEQESGARTPVRSTTQTGRRVEEDDLVVIEKRETRTPSVHESFADPFGDGHRSERGRSRATTIKSEDDFVMVSPPRDGRQRERSEGPSKSAFYDASKYTPEERRERRRSRSISFREKEARYHDAGEQLHERPGAEAALMGKYLNHYDVDGHRDGGRGGEERSSFEYHDVIRDNRGYGRDHREEHRYPPQRIRRDRSRHRDTRERERDSDDESYVSRVVEKTTKYTYY